jgi:hypothetical protein
MRMIQSTRPRAMTSRTGVAAPRTASALDALLTPGVFLLGAVAGGFLATRHEGLGGALVLLPLASLVVGLALCGWQPEPAPLLARRGLLLALVLVVIAGDVGRALLAVYIPAALATVAVAVRRLLHTAKTQSVTGEPA